MSSPLSRFMQQLQEDLSVSIDCETILEDNWRTNHSPILKSRWEASCDNANSKLDSRPRIRGYVPGKKNEAPSRPKRRGSNENHDEILNIAPACPRRRAPPSIPRRRGSNDGCNVVVQNISSQCPTLPRRRKSNDGCNLVVQNTATKCPTLPRRRKSNDGCNLVVQNTATKCPSLPRRRKSNDGCNVDLQNTATKCPSLPRRRKSNDGCNAVVQNTAPKCPKRIENMNCSNAMISHEKVTTNLSFGNHKIVANDESLCLVATSFTKSKRPPRNRNGSFKKGVFLRIENCDDDCSEVTMFTIDSNRVHSFISTRSLGDLSKEHSEFPFERLSKCVDSKGGNSRWKNASSPSNINAAKYLRRQISARTVDRQ